MCARAADDSAERFAYGVWCDHPNPHAAPFLETGGPEPPLQEQQPQPTVPSFIFSDTPLTTEMKNVLNEFKQLLAAAGYSTSRSQGATSRAPKSEHSGSCTQARASVRASAGSVHKYPRYLKLLFQNGVLLNRSDIFAEDAESRVRLAFEVIAHGMAIASASKRPARHYFSDLMRGYTMFVQLAVA